MEKESKHGKEYPTCNTRSSPKALYDATVSLSAARIKCLKEIGFEIFIHFPIVELPSTLAYHVIEKFHAPSMELRLQRGSIKATRQKVHDMLGIPMGSRKLEDLEKRTSKDTFITDTMGTLENGGRVPTKLIKYITKDVDISYIDWCRPAIGSWNTTIMRKRITMEKKQSCLGNLEHHGDFDPDEQQHGLDLYKGLDVYIVPLSERKPVTKEEFYETIIEKFRLISKERKVFKSTKDFHLDESFMDEDNGSDGDIDNDRNNSDEDGSPMLDGNKENQNENENEKQSGNDNEKESIKDMGKETEEGGSKENNDKEKDEDDVINENEYEKLNEEIRENAISRSVDNQNEEMKEKENNEEKVSEKDGNKNDDDIVDSTEVDDPNEKMKEKEADKEKESEKNGNEQKVENEKEKQYEADKVEKIKGIQNEHNHLRQDEF
nr:hypothetical protein [Tanacetum cinerariifolium]